MKANLIFTDNAIVIITTRINATSVPNSGTACAVTNLDYNKTTRCKSWNIAVTSMDCHQMHICTKC